MWLLTSKGESPLLFHTMDQLKSYVMSQGQNFMNSHKFKFVQIYEPPKQSALKEREAALEKLPEPLSR